MWYVAEVTIDLAMGVHREVLYGPTINLRELKKKLRSDGWEERGSWWRLDQDHETPLRLNIRRLEPIVRIPPLGRIVPRD